MLASPRDSRLLPLDRRKLSDEPTTSRAWLVRSRQTFVTNISETASGKMSLNS